MILKAAGVWLQAFGVLLWPFELRIRYSEAPDYLQWAGSLLHLGLFGLAMFRFSRGHRGLLAGLAIFYLDLLPSSRLISGGDVPPHLSSRYLGQRDLVAEHGEDYVPYRRKVPMLIPALNAREV